MQWAWPNDGGASYFDNVVLRKSAYTLPLKKTMDVHSVGHDGNPEGNFQIDKF
jgi:hypothetical protein